MSRNTPHVMPGPVFARHLNDLGIDAHAFAQMTGRRDAQEVRRWIREINPVPGWVPIVLALLKLPGAVSVAHNIATGRLAEKETRK